MLQVGELERRVLARGAQLHAAEAALAESLADFAESGEWEGYGLRSIGHWASIHLGIDARRACTMVDTAVRLRRLPLLRQGFREGALSFDKVRLAAAVATPESDEKFTSIARLGSAAQVARICGEYRKIHQPDDAEAAKERMGKRRALVQSIDDELARLTLVLEKDEMAIVVAAVDRRVEQHWRDERDSEHDQPIRDLAERRADAFVELAADAIDAGPDPVVAGDHIDVRVNIDAELLAGVREDGICSIDGFGAIPLSVVRTLCCDSRLTAMHQQLDGVFNLGRSRRQPNRAQRRCLRKRDGGCRYPGCPLRRYVQVHHAVPWEHDGPTDIDNLLELCPKHHRLFHAGAYTIDVNGAGHFSFRLPDGREIAPPSLRAKPPAGPPPPGDPQAQGRGERYDLALTIDALLGIDAA